MLLVNMNPPDAFLSLLNLVNKSFLKSFYSEDTREVSRSSLWDVGELTSWIPSSSTRTIGYSTHFSQIPCQKSTPVRPSPTVSLLR
jgi:hypothetical protein